MGENRTPLRQVEGSLAWFPSSKVPQERRVHQWPNLVWRLWLFRLKLYTGIITWQNIRKGLCYSKQVFSLRIENAAYWLFKCFYSFTAICKWGRWNTHKHWANLIGSEEEFDFWKRSPVSCPPKSTNMLVFGRWELGNGEHPGTILIHTRTRTNTHAPTCTCTPTHPRVRVKSIRAESQWWVFAKHIRSRAQAHANRRTHTCARIHKHAT